MKTLLMVVCFVTMVFTVPAFAETSIADVTGKVQIKEGTEVKLKLDQDLSSKTAHQGDPVNLVLIEDWKIGGVLIAKAGTKALGAVSNSKKSGSFGRGGELNIKLEYLKLEDSRLKLRASQGKSGDGKVATTAVLTLALGPVGFLKKGKQAEIKNETPVTAFVDEDTWVMPAK
jgi:hypothetical protein